MIKEALLNTLQALPRRFPAWVLGVFTAELLKLKGAEEARKTALAQEIKRKVRR